MSQVQLRAETRAMGGLTVLVTGLMVALGLLVLAGAAAIRHVDLDWRAALAGRWTVEIPYSDPGAPRPNPDIDQTIAALSAIPGVASVERVDPAAMRALLAPWLRDPALVAELPLPALLDIRLDPANGANATPTKAMAKAVAEKLPNARFDDHADDSRDLLRIARTGEALGLAFFAATALTLIVTVAATTRARLAVNADEIDLLHTLGATDGYIVRQFRASALRAAVIGAFAGTVAAALALVAFLQNGPKLAPYAARLTLDRIDLAVIAGAPVGAILLSAAVAGWAARAAVRRLK